MENILEMITEKDFRCEIHDPLFFGLTHTNIDMAAKGTFELAKKMAVEFAEYVANMNFTLRMNGTWQDRIVTPEEHLNGVKLGRTTEQLLELYLNQK